MSPAWPWRGLAPRGHGFVGLVGGAVEPVSARPGSGPAVPPVRRRRRDGRLPRQRQPGDAVKDAARAGRGAGSRHHLVRRRSRRRTDGRSPVRGKPRSRLPRSRCTIFSTICPTTSTPRYLPEFCLRARSYVARSSNHYYPELRCRTRLPIPVQFLHDHQRSRAVNRAIAAPTTSRRSCTRQQLPRAITRFFVTDDNFALEQELGGDSRSPDRASRRAASISV